MNDVKYEIVQPEEPDWECQLFGTGPLGLKFVPSRGQAPNWFWRLMQYLLLGNRWVRR